MSDSCQSTPKCPWCKTAKAVRESAANCHAWYCGKCRREFEAEDDGTIAYGSPDRRLLREERNNIKTKRAK
jgi:hypothetical protein